MFNADLQFRCVLFICPRVTEDEKFWSLSSKLMQWCKHLTKLDNQTFCSAASGMSVQNVMWDAVHFSTNSPHFLLSPLIISHSFYLSAVSSLLSPFLPPPPWHSNGLVNIAQNMTLQGTTPQPLNIKALRSFWKSVTCNPATQFRIPDCGPAQNLLWKRCNFAKYKQWKRNVHNV
jgi:hypothetical protein